METGCLRKKKKKKGKKRKENACQWHSVGLVRVPCLSPELFCWFPGGAGRAWGTWDLRRHTGTVGSQGLL